MSESEVKKEERTGDEEPIDVKEAEEYNPSYEDTNKQLLSRFGSRQEMSWKAFSIYCQKILNADPSDVDSLKKILMDGGIVKKERLAVMLDFFGPLAVESKAYAGEGEETTSALSYLALLISQHWFQGFIERKEAHKLLSTKPPGTFIVRFSSRKGKYALTVRVDNAKDNVMDWIIAPIIPPNNPHQVAREFRLEISGGAKKDSVMDLINHYSKNPLPVTDSKIKGPILVLEEVKKNLSNSGKNTSIEFDAFISHRQQNGADLAQLIKLHLQMKNDNLKIFLDVDDLHQIHDLKKNVENSRNLILLITEGVLDRPFVQMEIETAVNCKKNIIVVWDEKSGPFPTIEEKYSPQIKEILTHKAVPYHRQKEFRDVSIQMIYDQLLFTDEDKE